jgi:hypothetical protein
VGGGRWQIIMTMVVALRSAIEDELEDPRSAWVWNYRDRYPGADLWARGLRRIGHSLETQERVFRMAEQLERRGVDRDDVFTALEEADRCVALWNNPRAAAEAGHRAISTLLPLAQDALVICSADGTNWQGLGFAPISFDGHDPAAYAWVMFELSARANAERRARWRRCDREVSAMPTAVGLARL